MADLHLRRLGVWIDEPDPGQFFAVIHESIEDAAVWTDIWSSDESFPSWLTAHDAGNKELLRMVTNKKKGPRASGEDENASSVG